ncbi:hypothetical protein OG799_23760 [Micromonospora sp. NBC_00898]|uniref:hypothetical protein n=1 Tax=Micromonospora sp. NBC_00898 TaxID=2975981 RepID=UPI00386E5DC1|nr:hypothetical protein OG799_23760 [Micromonospora sp. NBC_00898]
MEVRAQPGRRPDAARPVRGVPDRGGADPGPAAPAGLVLAQVAAGLPVRRGAALPEPAPHPDQPTALADGGGEPDRLILAVHVRELDGMCAGCLTWWSRLSPYPCWQVEWATSRQARSITARFLGRRR